MSYLLPVFASVLPFFCWAVERVLPYPHLVEEVAKAVLVIFVIGRESKAWYQAILAGIFFAFTETVFYSFNLLPAGNYSVVLIRLTLTTLLHILTYLLITGFYKWDKRLIVVGLLLAILIHYYYNLQLAILF